MKTDTLDVAHRTADETTSPANPFLVCALWLVTRDAEYRRIFAHKRAVHLLKRSVGAIPAHLLGDIGIDKYQAAEILATTTRENRILIYPFFQTMR